MSSRGFHIPAYKIDTLGNINSYAHYIEKAGGLGFTFTAFNEEDAAYAAERFDGLLITGGGDLDPSLYGEENMGSGTPDSVSDVSDFLLYRAFKAAGKPILGICRGIQAIAVAEGIGLIQDIPGGTHNQRNAYPPLPINAFYHECSFEGNGKIHGIFGDRYQVNSFHHQALKGVPEGFIKAAMSDDGIIEAIECGNILAVQWHPERLHEDELHMKLGRVFIEECLSD